MHKFIILKNGMCETYNKYEDIPETFENLILFAPDIPNGPHTHEQHDEIHSWLDKLKDLQKRETN